MSVSAKYSIAILLLFLLILMGVFLGTVSFSLNDLWKALVSEDGNRLIEKIVWEVRVPRTITAVLAGAALSLAGLLMQTLFRNPLAGPSVLGISSGASLGVAVVVLSGSYWLSLQFGLISFALLGAGVVTFFLLLASKYVSGKSTLLLIGLMIGYFTSSLVSVLSYFGDSNSIKAYVNWGMGSFEGVAYANISTLLILLLLVVFWYVFRARVLNAFLLNSSVIDSFGISNKQLTIELILASSVLTAVVTAFCGPVGFIGIAVPQVARMLFGSHNHFKILPLCLLLGMIMALLSDVISRVPGVDITLPLNAVTSVIGAPIVVYVLVKPNKIVGRI